MADKTRIGNEIEVDVSGFFTTHHAFRTPTGTLGEIRFPAFSQYGIFSGAHGRELLMQKTHWLGTAHELVEGEIVRGTADRRGLLSRDMVICFDGRDYTLEPEGLLSQGWFLLDAERFILLEIQPRGILRQGSYLSLYGPVQPALLVFAYYLVYMRQQEDAAAVASMGAVAAS